MSDRPATFERYLILDSGSVKKYAFLIAAGILAACGSGSTDQDQQVNQFDQLNAAANALIADNLPLVYTDLASDIPSGTVGYAGYLVAYFENTNDDITDAMAGRMELDVSFDAPEMVSGRALGIYDEEGRRLTGTIDLTGGVLDRGGNPETDATFTFDGNGALVDANNSRLSMTMLFEGDFLNAGATGLGGNILGTLTENGVGQTLEGLFIMEIDSPS